jgi:predicted DsbA family dithiol-disulfide isomerase
MALESPRVRTDVVEVQEFPYLARLYGVRSVPMTVINNKSAFVGGANEDMLLDRVLETVELERVNSTGEDASGNDDQTTSL